MGEYEVVQSDLSAEEVTHVHLVCVEGAEEDLNQQTQLYPKTRKTTYIRCRHIVALSNLLVELLHVGEAGDDAGGRSLGQLTVEDQARSSILSFLSVPVSHSVVVILLSTEIPNVSQV